MALRINTNISAMSANRWVEKNSSAEMRAQEKLSSGSRINRSSDDAAGLAVSEKLRAQIRSTTQAGRNAGDAVSIVQIAEGGLAEIGNILIRLRELSVQSASDTIDDAGRRMIDLEYRTMLDEITRTANATEYNGRKLINGTHSKLDFQIGINDDPENGRFILDLENQSNTAAALGLVGLSIATKEGSHRSMDLLDFAINAVSESRATFGAMQNSLQSIINNLKISEESQTEANSRIRDTDFAAETAERIKNRILTQSSIAILGQANISPQSALKLLD
jgi:flagellin